ncbi:unnamed protein product, partial [Gulo gulo]
TPCCICILSINEGSGGGVGTFWIENCSSRTPRSIPDITQLTRNKKALYPANGEVLRLKKARIFTEDDQSLPGERMELNDWPSSRKPRRRGEMHSGSIKGKKSQQFLRLMSKEYGFK